MWVVCTWDNKIKGWRPRRVAVRIRATSTITRHDREQNGTLGRQPFILVSQAQTTHIHCIYRFPKRNHTIFVGILHTSIVKTTTGPKSTNQCICFRRNQYWFRRNENITTLCCQCPSNRRKKPIGKSSRHQRVIFRRKNLKFFTRKKSPIKTTSLRK